MFPMHAGGRRPRGGGRPPAVPRSELGARGSSPQVPLSIGDATAAGAVRPRALSVRSGFSAAAMLGVGAFCYPVIAGSGMGSLLTTRLAGTLDRQFYAKLMLKLDPGTMGLEFRDGQTRYVNYRAVSRILGLQSGHRKVSAGSGLARSRLVEEVQDLLGLHVGGGAGISVEDLKRVLQICDPDSLNKAESDAAKVAYTLLACVTFLAPRQGGSMVPDELLSCVVVPDEIGEYNWGEYVLDQLRNAAEKLQLAIVEGAKTLSLLGCNPLLQIFYFEWMDFGDASIATNLVPKIAAYTSDKLKELIKLDTADSKRATPRYKTRPYNYMDSIEERLHPLLSGGHGSCVLPKHEVELKLKNLIDDKVASMIQNAAVTAVAEMNPNPGEVVISDARKAAVVDEVFAGIGSKPKELLLKFMAALYPDAGHGVQGGSPSEPPSTASGRTARQHTRVLHEAGQSASARGDKGKQPMEESKGKQPMGEVSDDKDNSDDDGGDSFLVEADDHGRVLRRLFSEQSSARGTRIHQETAGGANTGGEARASVPGLVLSDEEFTRELQLLYNSNDVDHELLETLSAATVGKVSNTSRGVRAGQAAGHGLQRVTAAGFESSDDTSDDAMSDDDDEEMAEEDSQGDESVPPSREQPATPLDRRVLKRAGRGIGAHAPKRVRFSSVSRVQGRSSALGGRNLMAEFNHADDHEQAILNTVGASSSGGRVGAGDEVATPQDGSRFAGLTRGDGSGGSSSVRTLGVVSGITTARARVGDRTAYGVLIAIRPGQEMKVELDEVFPGDVGLHHEKPVPRFVFIYQQRLSRASAYELNMSWVIHQYPDRLVLTGAELKEQMATGGEIGMKCWKVIWRLLRQLENKMYRGSFLRWRHIFPPELAIELMSKASVEDLDFEYLGTMMSQQLLGYSLKFVKKLMLPIHIYESWALYVVDTDNKHMMIMDPCETSEPDKEMEDKHAANAHKVLQGLVRTIHECFDGWHVSLAGWTFEYNVGAHPSCTRAQSGVCIVHYIRNFNGMLLHTQLTRGEIGHLRMSLGFPVTTMQGNRGQRPRWLEALRA